MINPTTILNDLGKTFSAQAESFVEGIRKADVAQRTLQEKENYGRSIFDPRFRQQLNKQGVSLKNDAAEFLGAYTSRLVVDVATDGSRTYFWRWNHPLAIASGLSTASLGKTTNSPTGRALIELGIGLPAIAAAGTYDITNPEEQFRPKGFAQRYAPVGAEDRRTTESPGAELFERFFLGRTGDPLKYETAKQDIPDLTPQRYGNYQKFLYGDKGVLGLGILKATPENLQGVPEARLLGFPVTIPMATGFAGGTIAAKLALESQQKRPTGLAGRPAARIARGVVAGFAGSLAGVAAGNLINESIAQANRPIYPSTTQYDQNIG